MPAQRQFGHRVVVTDKANRLGVADLIDNFNTTPRLFDTKTTTSQNFFVTLGVQLGKSLAELEFFSVNRDGTIGSLFTLHGIGRKIVSIKSEEVTHTGALQFKITRHTVVGSHMNDAFLYVTKNPT